jgi:hypothetical protein
MMKKIKLLVAITFVVAITSILWKCQPNEDDITIPNPVSEQSQRRINKIPFKSLPFGLDNHLNRLSETFNKNRSSSEELLVFDESQIIEVIDSLSNTKYSIKFSIPDQPDNVLYNLVLGVDANNQESNPFILKYTINNPEEVYENLIPDFTKMKGTISQYRLETFLNSLTNRTLEESDCPPRDVGDEPSDEDSNNNDTNNQNGGGGSTGDPSNDDYNEPGGGDSNGDQGGGDIENPDDEEPVTCNVLVWSTAEGEDYGISWSCSDGSGGYGDVNRTTESECPADGDIGINHRVCPIGSTYNNGACEDDQNPTKICGDYSFKKIGAAQYANISNLHIEIYVQTGIGTYDVIEINLNEICISIPNVSAVMAKNVFNDSWELAKQDLYTAMSSDSSLLNETAATYAFRDYLIDRLKTEKRGSTLSTLPCNNVPSSIAVYCL